MPRFKLPLYFTLFILLTSCSIERRLAKQFNQTADQVSLLALRTDYIFKLNDKTIPNSGNNDFSDAEVDSINMSNTLIIKYLDDDQELLDFFFTRYISELKRYGLKVYEENEIESFVEADSNAWIVNLAQLELEEFDYPFRESEVISGTMYTFDYTINAMIFNAWFELSKVNEQNDIKPEILFASNTIYDEFSGSFVQNLLSGKVSYRLSHDTITMSSFMEFTAYMGRLYAAYTYDYLLNQFLSNKVDPRQRSKLWYRYDPYRKMLFTTVEDKFIPIND